MQKEESDVEEINRPSLFLLATEIGRAAAELGLSVPYRHLFGRKNHGDGHPILVLPGFLASDFSTTPLRNYLTKLGYAAYAWELGRNKAKLEYLDLLLNRIEELSEAHQSRVSLIGWSLGGVFARQLAKANPDLIRQIITLGSPFKGVDQANNVAWVYNRMNEREQLKETHPELFEDLPKPAPVPTTAIYSKGDGIVPWQLCMEEEDSIHQNIQVRGSHLGLGVNPTVWEIIEDRLLYSQENWIPFKPNSMVKDLLYYPSL